MSKLNIEIKVSIGDDEVVSGSGESFEIAYQQLARLEAFTEVNHKCPNCGYCDKSSCDNCAWCGTESVDGDQKVGAESEHD